MSWGCSYQIKLIFGGERLEKGRKNTKNNCVSKIPDVQKGVQWRCGETTKEGKVEGQGKKRGV